MNLHKNAMAPSDTCCASKELRRTGFTILRSAVPPSMIAQLDADLDPRFAATPFCEGGFYGQRTKRFGRLLLRSPRAADLVMHPEILGHAEAVLGPYCDRIQLNLTQAIALHPGALAQFPHRDQDMWAGETGHIEYLLNVMWPLTPFTSCNGATRIWPESHGAAAQGAGPDGEPVVAVAEPGDAILFLGSTLHGAGGNRSAGVRRAIIISYCLGWLKTYENQYLAYPPHLARRFSPDLAALVGYAQHRPNLGNFEGQCPSVLFDGYPDEPLAAIDALRPEQTLMLADHVAQQRGGAGGAAVS